MYTTGHMLRDEVIALHAFAAQCHGVQTMRVFNVYPNSKYTVVWGPRRYHYFSKNDIWPCDRPNLDLDQAEPCAPG